MPNPKSGVMPAVALLIIVATAAGLFAAFRRFHVEAANRRVEIAVEWQEIATLAQASAKTIPEVLAAFKAQHVTTVVIAEDTITGMEQAGAVHPIRTSFGGGPGSAGTSVAFVLVDTELDIDRIRRALDLRGQKSVFMTGRPADGIKTVFEWREPPGTQPAGGSALPRGARIGTTTDYVNLRAMGLGLPPEAVAAVQAAGMEIAGRIGNFPGVSPASAKAALEDLSNKGASTVIFSGEDVLGYRGLEPDVAGILRGDALLVPGIAGKTDPPGAVPGSTPPTMPTYGAVEFGKQKGDEKLSARLKGEFVRVHSIQAAEMGQMEEDEAVDRFVRAAKERNIRFCYVRLVTFAAMSNVAGADPLSTNTAFLGNISHGMASGNIATGGGMGFGSARRFAETGVPRVVFGLIGLGTAAGVVWMLHALAPLSFRREALLLAALGILFAAAAVTMEETGRKLVAFVAGVTYPTTACLLTYPGRRRNRPSAPKEPLSDSNGDLPSFTPSPPQPLMPSPDPPLPPLASLTAALRQLGVASLITSIGIVQVVGLLATRPFMLRANQFLGIKAQHAVPVLLIALVAIAGGVAAGDKWEDFLKRAQRRIREAMNEPARFGMLALGLIALAGFLLVVARTGNDAGVGVSGVELKLRATLDRILPVRPRTKEFLVGHPAFVLALAWWWRGRRRLAVPAFVVGSLGQVSLLNTFCHIHTPLIVSVWRDGLGLLFGAMLGAALFLGLEALFAAATRGAKAKPSDASAPAVASGTQGREPRG